MNQWEFFFDMNQFFKNFHPYSIPGQILLHLAIVQDSLLELDWWDFSYEVIEVNIFSLSIPKPDALPG